MAYSTESNFRNNGSDFADTVEWLTADITQRITMADNIVNSDLSGLYNIPNLLTISPVPNIVNLLSQYKTCELLLVYKHTQNRQGSTSDIEYWQKLYNDLLNKILTGNLKILKSDGSILDTGITIDGISSVPENPQFGFGDLYGPDLSESLDDITV